MQKTKAYIGYEMVDAFVLFAFCSDFGATMDARRVVGRGHRVHAQPGGESDNKLGVHRYYYSEFESEMIAFKKALRNGHGQFPSSCLL